MCTASGSSARAGAFPVFSVSSSFHSADSDVVVVVVVVVGGGGTVVILVTRTGIFRCHHPRRCCITVKESLKV